MTMLSEKLKDLLSKFLIALSQFREWLSGFRLPPGWQRGAIWSVGILVLLYAVFIGYHAQSGYGPLIDILVSIVVAGIGFFLLLWMGSLLIRWLFRTSPIVWVLILAGFLFGGEVWGSLTWLHWFFNLILALCCAMSGAGLLFLIQRQWRGASMRQKVLSSSLLVLGLLGIVIVGGFIFSPGNAAQPLLTEVDLGPAQIEAPNPSLPGTYAFETLTYGSGTDLRRSEFGSEADLLTESVNGSAYVSFSKEMPKGLPSFLREWDAVEFVFARYAEVMREVYWGFGTADLPLNGRVWYPTGEGPFPLVLIVHGNHSMVEDSDLGYAYLGELLASRGFILVSVDENFLNGGFWGKSSGENDARAWLLLQHLHEWQAWNQDPSSPFFNSVDMSRIALIGHSRGGEAVALAAAFNELSRYPNNARTLWDFGFKIRSVIALAPVDEQWLPADHSNPLTDINYLVLQGSHDGDVYHFDGIQQYNRTTFSGADPEVFKAAVYIYRANHGQFNSVWGAKDKSGMAGQFLNRNALLSASEQEQIAKVYLSAFLEATLNGKNEYREIFKDYRAAGDWLPQTAFISQYEDIGSLYVADFEEDIDVLTTRLAGGRIEARGFQRWSEMAIRFRNNNRQDNHVVRLGWSNPSAYYAIQLPNGLASELDLDSILVFKAADARKPETVTEGLDFSILLRDKSGQQAALILSEVLPLQTQFPAEISRLAVWNDGYYKDSSEEVFQTYRIELEYFLLQNPGLRLKELSEIRFEFSQTSAGMVYLDDVGFDVLP